jgi:hypothetical protein
MALFDNNGADQTMAHAALEKSRTMPIQQLWLYA